MKIERPQFELTRVLADGTSGAPEIIRVGCMPWDARMERRGFLGVGVGVASVLLLETACRNKSSDVPAKVPDRVLKAHRYQAYSLAISPDGKLLASGALAVDESIKLWSLPDGKLLATLEGHKASVYAVAISPDGKTLASGSRDNTIKLWSLPDGKPLATIEGHKNGVNALAISPDGKLLASGSSDETIKLWSLPEGNLVATLEGHKGNVYALAISPDGKLLASGFLDETIKLWSLPEGKPLATLEGLKGSVYAVAISPDGKLLASGSGPGPPPLPGVPAGDANDETIKLWSLPDGKLLATLERHKDWIHALAITPDGKTLASGSNDGTIKLWSLPEGKLLATVEGHKDWVNDLSISPDGKLLASGDNDGVIIIWDLEKRSFLTFLFDPKANEVDAPSTPGGGGGGYCTCNKVCTCIPVPSDREVKEAFETPDPLLILQKLSELPIQSWNYKWNNALIRHIGPMAQDFAAAFAVGEDDKHIHPVDAQGIAFAAIQGLYRIIKEKEARTESLQAQLRRQQEENETLSARVEALERLVRDAAVGRGGRARI